MAGDWRAEDVGPVLLLLRRLRRWKQEKLAREAGVPRKQLSTFEKGKVAPGPEVLERIAAAVGLPFLVVRLLISW